MDDLTNFGAGLHLRQKARLGYYNDHMRPPLALILLRLCPPPSLPPGPFLWHTRFYQDTPPLQGVI
jgi:hypothetical protein